MNAVVAVDPPMSHPVIAADVPMERLHVKKDFNPRIWFGLKALEELAASIRVKGVVQSIAIREREDMPGHYWIIAGERRWRAGKMAGLTAMPCRIFQVTEDEAHDIASAENGPREDLSPGEEALEARRMMMRHRDRDEAARYLGWSKDKLDARLLLTQATEAVLEALAKRRIQLGHAELLSPLPPATQGGTLEEVIERGVSVDELRKRLAAFSLDLGTACFDKGACQQCPHNTTRQASLFEQNVGEGRCTNRPCFHQKTVRHLEDMRPALRDRYNTVVLDTERDSNTWTVLLKRDVGHSQFEVGCAQCANFGCVLSSRPGEAGKVTEDVCFDLACRQQKIEANRPAVPTSGDPKAESATATLDGTRPKARPPAAAPKRPGAIETPRAVRDKCHSIQRRAAGAEVQANPKMAQVYAVLALLSELSLIEIDAGENDPLTKRGIRRRGRDRRVGLLPALYALEESALQELTCELAGRVAAMPDNLSRAQATLRMLEVDLARHFVLDADFLSVHTKAGIEGVLREAHFDRHCNQHDQNAFRKLLTRKHDEIIKDVIASSFVWRGFVPKCVLEGTR